MKLTLYCILNLNSCKNTEFLGTNLLPFVVCKNLKVIHTRSPIKAELNQAVLISDWFCKHSWTV